MGVRRAKRPAVELAIHLSPDKPMLVDASGSPVTSLYPLVQLDTPVPGAPKEMFLLEGPGRRGARLVARPHVFEHQDAELWGWVRAKFLPQEEDAEAGDRVERAPYRGLSTFKLEDADLYFGREKEAELFANRIRIEPLLAVVGPSGAGKSSFIQAGVVPILPDDFQVVIVRPGAAPVAALIARIDGAKLDIEWDEPEDAKAIAAAIRDAMVGRGESLLLVVDQFEELFTLCQDLDERADYADILTQLAADEDAPVRVVLTLRDDFLMKAQSLPLLRDRLTHSLQLLATPDRDDLLRILVEPARRVGYSFEDDDLPVQMVDEVGEHPSALALLSFAAAQLWELRDRQSRKFRRVAYESMGGVGGALAHHADAVLADMSADELLVVREAFRHLVTAQGTRAVLSRDELDQLLGHGPHSQGVLEKLVGARLLVAREGDQGSELIEITHEALIVDWPQLAKWRREDAEGARLRDELRAAARQWDERDRPNWLLWRGEALTEYQLWRARFPGGLTVVEEDFAAASRKIDARSKQLRRAALIGAFVALAAGLVLALWLRNRAAEQRQWAQASEARAKQRLVDLRVEQARQALIGEDPLRGLAYLREAIVQGADSPTVHHLLGNGMRALDAQLVRLDTRAESVSQAAFVAGDRRIVTGALHSPAKVWDADTGELVHTYEGDATVFAVSPDGRRLVTGGSDGAVRLWELGESRLIREFAAAQKGPARRLKVMCVAFSHDGSALVAGKADRKAYVWDVNTGEERVRVAGHSGPVLSCSFNGDSSRLLTAGGTQRIWDSRTGESIFEIGSPGYRAQAAYSSDHSAIVTYSVSSPIVQVWEAATGKLAMELDTSAGGVNDVHYSADGKRIVVATTNGSAQLWQAESGLLELSVRGHENSVLAVALSRDQTRLATAGGDRTIIIWDVASGDQIAIRNGHVAKVLGVQIDSTGNRVLSASQDGTARVWSMEPGGLDERLRPEGDQIVATIFSPDGRQLLTYSPSRVVRLWSAEDGELLHTYDGARREFSAHGLTWFADQIVVPDFEPGGSLIAVPIGKNVQLLDGKTLAPVLQLQGHQADVTSAVFSPDGRTLVTTSMDTTARAWSVDSGEELRVLRKGAGPLFHSSISPDGSVVAVGGAAPIVWMAQLRSGEPIRTLKGHHGPISALSFSPDGNHLVTASPDTTIRSWEARTGKLLIAMETLSPVFSVQFSSDGAFIAAIESTGRASLWDTVSGLRLSNIGTAAEFGYWLDIDPRGERIALSNGTGEIWNVAANRQSLTDVLNVLSERLPYVLEGDRLVANPADEAAAN